MFIFARHYANDIAACVEQWTAAISGLNRGARACSGSVESEGIPKSALMEESDGIDSSFWGPKRCQSLILMICGNA